MRVIFMRTWVKRALCSWLVLLVLVALALIPEPVTLPRSPFHHIPSDYILHRIGHPHLYTLSGCVSPPGLTQIQYSKALWQHVSKPSERERPTLVFAAYWDTREEEPLVRLLVHSERELPSMRCLFWYYNKGDPVLMEASAPADPESKLHVVSCVPPEQPAAPPAALSLAAAGLACGVTRNILGIQGIPDQGGVVFSPTTTPGPASEGRRTAACAVWWRRGDAAVRLAEWLQMLRYFEVDRVYFYVNHNAHGNVMRVLDYYKYQAQLDGMTIDIMPYISPPKNGSDVRVRTKSTVRSIPTTHAQGNDFDEYSEVKEKDEPIVDSDEEEAPPIDQDDLFPYNHCIYRAMLERIDWVAPLDLDEIILPVGYATWGRLAVKVTRKAQREIDETPDVLDFDRWWFPEMLQANLSPPSTERPATRWLTNYPGAGPAVSPAPLVVPSGRIFQYELRAPTARADAAVTGKLLRVGRVAGVGRRGARCVGAGTCSVRHVDPDTARVHLYTSVCGGFGRGVCRALRRVAVREGVLWKWRRAQQEAAITLRRVQLQPHARTDADDL